MGVRKKPKYYTLKRILEYKAHYNIIIGERSNGKTYACLEYALERFTNNGEQFAYIRRWQDDIKGKRVSTIFNAIISNGLIAKYSGGEWTDIYYFGGKFYLCRTDEESGKIVKSEKPFGYAFAISSMEHDKSTSYPEITTVIFDEFLTRSYYLPDEFILFSNCLSTIIRDRTNVIIFMLGNTVNKYCPYFSEMGLKHIKDMEQGTIDLYTYGDYELKVAVEYCGSRESKPSDLYFAFDNPKLNMITGGTWEISIYPHCPTKYRPKDIIFIFFIEFDNELLQCEVVNLENGMFLFIHRKTTPLKDTTRDLIYTTTPHYQPNYRMRITHPIDDIDRKLLYFFNSNLVFYQDNEVGEIIRNYFQWSKQFNQLN